MVNPTVKRRCFMDTLRLRPPYGILSAELRLSPPHGKSQDTLGYVTDHLSYDYAPNLRERDPLQLGRFPAAHALSIVGSRAASDSSYTEVGGYCFTRRPSTPHPCLRDSYNARAARGDNLSPEVLNNILPALRDSNTCFCVASFDDVVSVCRALHPGGC